MGQRLCAEHAGGAAVLEHDGAALAGIHGVQEVPHQVSVVTSSHRVITWTLQISEDPDGDAGVQCLAWSAPGLLSLTRLRPLLSHGEFNVIIKQNSCNAMHCHWYVMYVCHRSQSKCLITCRIYVMTSESPNLIQWQMYSV